MRSLRVANGKASSSDVEVGEVPVPDVKPMPGVDAKSLLQDEEDNRRSETEEEQNFCWGNIFGGR